MNNHFVFVAPMYNAAATLPRMLHSLYGQSYENWSLFLIDDVSDEFNKEKSKSFLEKFDAIDSEKITVIWNDKKKWEVENVLNGISLCKDEDIICRIDADDWLTDLDALAILDTAYAEIKCEALWTAHRWSYSDKNISDYMPNDANPYEYPWVSSHLKTFRKYLINSVKDENYRGPDGNYIRRAGDQAIYLPALQNTKKRFFLPRVTYHYTIKDVPETYQTADALFQRDEAEFLRQRGYVK